MKFLLTLIGIISFISGCKSDFNHTAFAVATNVWPGYESLHLAEEEGLYKNNINVTSYDSATIVLNKFRKKEIDAAALTLDEAILLYDQGYNPVIIAVLDISDGADALVARSEIKSIFDLKDKSIGVENSALGSYMLSRVLEKANLTYADVILVPLEANRHEEAFKENIIDSVITFEPVRSSLIKAGGVDIFSSKDIPGEIVDVLVVQKNIKDTELINDLLHGWAEAALKIDNRDSDSLRIVSSRLKQSEEEFVSSLDGLSIPSLEKSNQFILNGTLKSTIKKISNIMYEKKLIKSKIDPKAILKE